MNQIFVCKEEPGNRKEWRSVQKLSSEVRQVSKNRRQTKTLVVKMQQWLKVRCALWEKKNRHSKKLKEP